jgi:hypothetical protein
VRWEDPIGADLHFATVHKAKGLEWQDVFVSGDLYGQGDSPNPASSSWSITGDDFEDEVMGIMGFGGGGGSMTQQTNKGKWGADTCFEKQPKGFDELFKEPFEEVKRNQCVSHRLLLSVNCFCDESKKEKEREKGVGCWRSVNR